MAQARHSDRLRAPAVQGDRGFLGHYRIGNPHYAVPVPVDMDDSVRGDCYCCRDSCHARAEKAVKITVEIPDEYEKIIKAFEAKTGKSFEEFASKSLESVLEVLPRVHRLRVLE